MVSPHSMEYESMGLSDTEAMFLRTLIDAYNRDNDYPIECPMNRHLKDRFDGIRVTDLEEREFIKQHNLGRLGAWYTPTSKAQQAVNRSCRAGEGKGDRGEDTPHRLMTFLTARYFETLPEVDRARVYYPVGEGEYEGLIDAVGLDEDRTPVHIAEIEGGEKNQVSGTNVERWGTNNSTSVAKDYMQMASTDAEAWWITRNTKVAERVMQHLINEGRIPLAEVTAGPMRRKRLQIASLDERLPGLAHIHTLTELWEALETGGRLPEPDGE